MQAKSLCTPDGAGIVLRTWAPDGTGPGLGSEQQTRLWPRMAQWLGGLSAVPAA